MRHLLIIGMVALWAFSANSFAAEDSQKKFQYDSKGKRDPFVPIDAREVETETIQPVDAGLTPKEKLENKGIVVSSIVWDANNPAILIGDSILEVGQTVKGVIIRAIEKDYVVFEVDGELVEIPFT